MLNRAKLSRALGFPKVKVKWLRFLVLRWLHDWYRNSKLCQAVGSGIVTPVDAIFRQLELRELLPPITVALDVFGGSGLKKTVDLVAHCEHITHMEIEESISHHARKVLPKHKTRFLNEDSILAIRQGTLGCNKYTFILIDNDAGCYGPGYCENFDLFPKVLDYLDEEGVVVLNVWLDINEQHPDDDWLSRRREFFGLQNNEHARQISYSEALKSYLSKIPSDFSIRDSFPVTHDGETFFLVIALQRQRQER